MVLRFSIVSKRHAALQLSPKAPFPVGAGLLVPKKQAACPEFVPDIRRGNLFPQQRAQFPSVFCLAKLLQIM
jgi:hypothetical protein